MLSSMLAAPSLLAAAVMFIATVGNHQTHASVHAGTRQQQRQHAAFVASFTPRQRIDSAGTSWWSEVTATTTSSISKRAWGAIRREFAGVVEVAEVSGGSSKQRKLPVVPIMMTSHKHHQHHVGRASSTRPPRPPARIDREENMKSTTRKKISTVSQAAARRKSGFVVNSNIWKKFKNQQKEVTDALLEKSQEKSRESAMKLIQASGSPRANEAREIDFGGAWEGAAGGHGGDEARMSHQLTLGRFMMESCLRSPETEAMLPIMKAVGKTCTAVSRLVRRAQVEGMAGLHQEADSSAAAGESVNVQGEVQKELDVLSNSIFLTGLCQPHDMSCVASEEEESPRMCCKVVGEETHGGQYAAVFDPLDGSANIEAGLPCGTIFGILRTSGSAREGRTAGPSTIVLSGRRLVAAGYCLYGPSTKLVFTLGDGVFEFTLDEATEGRGTDDGGIGGGGLEFLLSRSDMRIPSSGNLYSVNEANSPSWSEPIQDFFSDLKTVPVLINGTDDRDEDKESSKSSSMSEMENQYVGALVADIHNILIHGGVFAYPADVKNPNGKLRLLYEGNPIAMIIEQAGGVATTGFEAIRDVRPQSVHHRIPAFFGSPDNLLPLLDPRYLHSRHGGSRR